MAGINRKLRFAAFVIIAQRSVKLTERNPASLFCKSVSFSRLIIFTIITISVISIQLIICIIVIQRTGNILCVWIFCEWFFANIYNIIRQFLAFFGITPATFFSPVAATVATVINYIIAGIRKETRFGKVGWDVHHVRTITVIGCFFVLNCPRSKTDFCITIRHFAIPDVGVL